MSRPAAAETCPPPKLSGREIEVLRLVAEDKSSAEIAAELWVSVRTIDWRLWRIYRKLGVRGRAGAVIAAARLGLLVI